MDQKNLKQVSVEELVQQKVLPFDLYNEYGERIFSAGEVLTPGKLLQLRYISAIYIYKEEEEETDYLDDLEDFGDLSFESFGVDQDQEMIPEESEAFSKPEEPQSQPVEDVIENEICCLPVESQKDIKSLYKKAFDLNIDNPSPKTASLFSDARDKVVDEILPIVDEIVYKSQLRVYGDYDYAHGINVAMLSTVLACKLQVSEHFIRDIALAAMLHDIGKSKIPKEILDKNTPTAKETKLIQLHPQIGYKILKKEMGISEYVARIVLEHHERNDGSGFPYGLSGDLIRIGSQIVIVCDVYDVLISGRGHVKVKTSKEAIKAMLEVGTKWFTPSVLYTFVHMSNYNDNTPTHP